MIKSVLHFFKIHRKVILGNPPVIVQNMFCKTPKTLDAVDVIFPSKGKRLRVVDSMVFTESFERVVTLERVRVIDRTLSRFLPYYGHQLIFRDMLHNPRVDPSIALQKAKNNAFTPGPSSSSSFASAAEVCLIKLDLTLQFFSFKFSDMVGRFTKSLVYSTDRLIVEIKIVREAICRLLFVEPSHDRNFSLQLLQRFLFSTGFTATPDVSTFRTTDLERTAKYTLPSSQKVGRTTENVISSCNHKDILTSLGYDSN